ncbi:2-oxoglutarate synthase, partial [Patescibacteria group bacterium]|nr:2-oxoglutarate synthase [Patescibacteria group bacterium]
MIQPNFPKSIKAASKPHSFCPGCGHPLVLKAIAEVIDELGLQDKTVVGLDIGCSLLAWDFFDIDSTQTHHGRTGPVISGFKKVKPEAIGIVYMGDGGAYAIGAQHLVNEAMRNEPVTVIVVNNSCYAMTGGQEAATTLPDQITSTTPYGSDQNFLDGPKMIEVITNQEAYIARGSIDNPIQLKSFIKKSIVNQQRGKGFSFVEALSVCPTNWKTDAKATFD